MPEGGFGNLIALPLQAAARSKGNSVFLDEELEPFRNEEQWELLAGVTKIRPETVSSIVARALREGTVLGVRSSEMLDDEDIREPWTRSPSGKPATLRITGPLPEAIHVTLAQQVFITRAGLPSALLSHLKRIAAFHNPEFYKKRSMRRSTWNTPRIICCAQNLEEHLSLPRGCLAGVEELAASQGVRVDITDKRQEGTSLEVAFHGNLSPIQKSALDALASNEIGVLVAPPGTGKTVIAAALIALRARSTLILVHRLPILEQWRSQLAVFLKSTPEKWGKSAAENAKPTDDLTSLCSNHWFTSILLTTS